MANKQIHCWQKPSRCGRRDEEAAPPHLSHVAIEVLKQVAGILQKVVQKVAQKIAQKVAQKVVTSFFRDCFNLC